MDLVMAGDLSSRLLPADHISRATCTLNLSELLHLGLRMNFSFRPGQKSTSINRKPTLAGICPVHVGSVQFLYPYHEEHGLYQSGSSRPQITSNCLPSPCLESTRKRTGRRVAQKKRDLLRRHLCLCQQLARQIEAEFGF